MPELPEVETIKNGICPKVAKQTVQEVVVRQAKLRWPIPPDLKESLIGQTIESITRRGKYLLLHCQHGTLIIHLGMSGSLRVLPLDAPVEKHDHVDFVFSDHVLRYRDPRRFGAILWHMGPIEQHPLLATLGPEPLSDDWHPDYLFQHTRSRNTTIKQWLMDSHQVVGVGNIYANEALFYAGILPTRPACSLDRHEAEKLCIEVKKILQKAIALGGSTLKDFVNAKCQPGYFQQHYAVYGRTNEPCLHCQAPIEQIRLGQRSTYFCPICQS